MFRTILALCGWLLAVFVAVCVYAYPPLVPGDTNWLAAMIGVVFLLAGPWCHGGRCSCRPLFFIYGCLGGLMFVPLFYPDRRALLRQAMDPVLSSTVGDWAFTIVCVAGVVCAGVVCRLIAAASYDRANRNLGWTRHCQKCGYPLWGLPEPRCPECGTPFDPPDDPPATDDE